jgi:hypothetical protein
MSQTIFATQMGSCRAILLCFLRCGKINRQLFMIDDHSGCIAPASARTAPPRVSAMPETLQDYLKRLQSYLGDRDPLKVQAATPKKLEQLMKRVPRRRLMKRPAPENGRLAKSSRILPTTNWWARIAFAKYWKSRARRFARLIRTNGPRSENTLAAIRRNR